MSTVATNQTATAHDKDITIIVNSRERPLEAAEVSFGKLVQLAGFAFPPENANIYYEITYRNAVAPRRDGTLFEDQVLTVKNGTNVHVSRTDRS